MKPTVYLPSMLTLVALAACNSLSSPIIAAPHYTTYQVEGDSATVAGKLDEFRAALGGALNAPNAPPAADGRREINWDGVPPAVTNVDNFPLDFFNVNSKRGALLSTPGTGLRVDSLDFGVPTQFHSFSPKKLFAAVGSDQVAVDFKIVGTNTNGLVKGFGVVFSDVDIAGSTVVVFYDAAGAVLASLAAPAKNSADEFSFLGAVFDTPLIARVVIVSGNAALSAAVTDVSAGGTKDLVVMDDFVYGEPQP
ncbi:MAG TPA: hypothetical protein VFI79_06665 [Gemmatimonadales bacterium]|nr:hypothetical protein [Gemmatimonadales bacterium]